MANHQRSIPGNVVSFRGDGETPRKQRDTPIVPSLPATIDRLREIAELSGDALVTEWLVHPDHRLLALCAAALDLVRQVDEARAIQQRTVRLYETWTDADRDASHLADDRRRALNMRQWPGARLDR